jgi:hypothetical protein
MEALAASAAFKTTCLLNERATADAILSEIDKAARDLASGDCFCLTFAGHGGQLKDYFGDEADGWDETMVCFERQLVDDELKPRWSAFKEGVRIVVVADSCHSGTIVLPPILSQLRRRIDASDALTSVTPRAMPDAVARIDAQRRGELYRRLEKAAHSRTEEIVATVLSITACQDNQSAADGPDHGLFTKTLLEVWQTANGAFPKGYRELWSAIVRLMPASQSPNYLVIGAPNPSFERQQPFRI